MDCRLCLLAPGLLLALACGDDSSDAEGAPNGGGADAGVAPGEGGPDAVAPGAVGSDAGTAAGPGITSNGDCGKPSLVLEGMIHSPGGDVLPFGCEPFHATTNNPYAVRCVDAWPWFETGFPGDDYCVLPPEPGRGVQIGVHPQGPDWFAQVSTGDLSGYDEIPDSFTMEPGEEEEKNYSTSVGTTEEFGFYRNYVRMRAGSHHMIVSGSAGVGTETWSEGEPVGLYADITLPGAQRPDANTPQTHAKPDEDEGLFRRLPANLEVTQNMHHFNSTDKTILKETWTNLWWEDGGTVEVETFFGMPVIQAARTFAQPGQTIDYHYTWTFAQDVRVIDMFGHRHAWTTNFSAWRVDPGGDPELLYQSFDWFDQPNYRFDSGTVNPATATEQRQDGATSGVLTFKAGDELHFNCHMEYTDERAVAEDSPLLPIENGPLRFSNQAFAGEMCILFGSSSGYDLPRPVFNNTPPPEFATVD